MRPLLILFVVAITLFAYTPKTPSDVYSYAMLLKQKVDYLRKKKGITKPFPSVPPQKGRYPRHVIQKALEILSKINLYRIAHHYGAIAIPVYPSREITPSDVYEMVKRLDAEVTPFIDDEAFLDSLQFKHYKGKTPNDVYRLLWSISLAFDDLLGIYGYTPSDVFKLSLILVKNSRFLRESQNIYSLPQRPKPLADRHPNHALYKSIEYAKKLHKAQQNLWIRNPINIPQKPHKVVIPNEVYDSLQHILAEIQRVKYRLGLERYFKIDRDFSNKTPSDVEANIEYAKRLLPLFEFDKKLVQYPSSSLQKTPNHVFAVTEEILKKISILKNLKGIQQQAKEPPYIYGLKPIHAYQKSIEATEKAIRLKVQMGFYPSQVPSAPLRPITPNEVYESVIRLDAIVTILLNSLGYKSSEYIYKINKKIPKGKTPSDVYHNLWIISNEFDILLNKEYTPNETFMLAKYILDKLKTVAHFFYIKDEVIQKIVKSSMKINDKRPADVFELVLQIFDRLKRLQERLNMGSSSIVIPKEDRITPSSVYNALRLVNATLNEIIIEKNIDMGDIKKKREKKVSEKKPNDVYMVVKKIDLLLDKFYDENSYE